MFDAISRIEKSVRTRFIYGLALKYGPFPFEYSRASAPLVSTLAPPNLI
ncbi:hypothetical protein [Bullifex porci]|nr:hypothetical protein [Bullifex porci]MDD7256535.1 hypothetical protein [Bullifex porci]MDY2740953.1 hypothetical protein [Bullifex porci]